MGSKANILALLVLCMAWQAHAYVNCNRTGPGKFPDPADTTCQGFTLCIHKHATDSLIGLKFVCPNQKIFNPHYGYCVFDSKYNCNGSNSTSPGNTDSTSTCTEEGVFADPYSTNCKTYITCLKINGTLTESIHKCPYDAIFDPSFGFCVYGTNYTCSGSNSTSSGNNNTDSTSTCTEEGVFADPYSTNCKTYITCFKINGTLTESIHKCPYDAIFDPSFGFCVYGTNYTCSGSNSTSSGNNNTDSTSTCTEEGVFADPYSTNCKTYITCFKINGTLTESIHKCPYDAIFDPSFGFCVYGTNYTCSGSNSTFSGNNNTDSTSTCTEEGVFADPYSTNCKTYITCFKINGTLTETIHKCPYDAIFDPSFGFCVYGTNYTCSGSNSTSSGNNNTDSTSTCTEEGVFADPYSTNCKTYITCFKINGTLTESILKCPYDAIFDPSFGFCVYVTNYTCSGSNSTSSGNNSTDSTSTCTEEGVFADPYSTNCKTYITCFKINGTLTESIHKCPYDAIFDPSFGFCVYGTNYTCNGSNGTYPGPGNNNTNSSSICTEEGFVANPDSYNCSTYVGCVKINSTFVKYVYSCPSSTFFNPNTTFCESSYSCKTVEPFACTSTGRFADVSDVTCQSFFFCTEGVNGVFIQHNYTCPPPSVFSPISGLCTTSHTCNRSV